jgi:hypothetical protein
LWSLIGRVYAVHPKLKVSVHSPDIISMVQITLVAWQRRLAYLQHSSQSHFSTDSPNKIEPPTWISELSEKFDLPVVSPTLPVNSTTQETVSSKGQNLNGFDFDFDSIDWSLWEKSSLDMAFCETSF